MCLSKTFLCMWATNTLQFHYTKDSFTVQTLSGTVFISSKHSNFGKGPERNWKLTEPTALFHNSLQKEFSLFLDTGKECGYSKKISDNTLNWVLLLITDHTNCAADVPNPSPGELYHIIKSSKERSLCVYRAFTFESLLQNYSSCCYEILLFNEWYLN